MIYHLLTLHHFYRFYSTRLDQTRRLVRLEGPENRYRHLSDGSRSPELTSEHVIASIDPWTSA